MPPKGKLKVKPKPKAVKKTPSKKGAANKAKKTQAAKKVWEGPQARIAVAGAGWWSQGWHLPHLYRNPGSKITAIIEPNCRPRSTLNPDMKTTGELSVMYGVPVFENIDKFLESDECSNTDGIIVASNHASHHEIAKKAMGKGLHILCEKPMTCDPKEAEDLVTEASRTGKTLMVNNTANFREKTRLAFELVKDGKIGTVKHVMCYMGSQLLWLFDNPANEGWVKPSGNMTGNGFGWGQLSHTLAWVYYVSGLTPQSVFASMVHSEITGADLFDSGIVKCTNGATINIQGVAALPFESYDKSSKQIDNKIFGSEGLLMYSGDDKNEDSGALTLWRHDGTKVEYPGFIFEDYTDKGDGPESLQQFILACAGKCFFNAADATVGMKAAKTIDAMYQSVKSGSVALV